VHSRVILDCEFKPLEVQCGNSIKCDIINNQ
jgi:hypothetical protein